MILLAPSWTSPNLRLKGPHTNIIRHSPSIIATPIMRDLPINATPRRPVAATVPALTRRDNGAVDGHAGRVDVIKDFLVQGTFLAFFIVLVIFGIAVQEVVLEFGGRAAEEAVIVATEGIDGWKGCKEGHAEAEERARWRHDGRLR